MKQKTENETKNRKQKNRKQKTENRKPKTETQPAQQVEEK